MGKQYNKSIKRRRRMAYNERKKNIVAKTRKSVPPKSNPVSKKPASAPAAAQA